MLFNVESQKELGKGTAFLVAPNILLTCAHNVWDLPSKKFTTNLRFFPGLHGKVRLTDGFKVEEKEGRPVIFVPRQYREGQQEYDFAFIKLEQEVKMKSYLPILRGCTRYEQVLKVCGYALQAGNFVFDEERWL